MTARLHWYQRDAVIAMAIFLVAVLPRVLPAAGGFLNVDAAAHWIARTKTFEVGLISGNLTQLAPSGHPGVPLMWLTAGADFFLRGTQLYQQFDHPLEAYLHIIKIPMMLVTALAPVAVWLIGRRIWSRGLALSISILLALEPLYLVFSRYLQLDGLVLAFLVVGLVAWWRALQHGERGMAAIAGISLALAGLSRLNGLVGAFYAVIVWLITFPRLNWQIFRWLLGSAIVTVAVVWPVTIFHPIFTLSTIGWGVNLGLTPHEFRSASESSFVKLFYFPLFLFTRTWLAILGLALVGSIAAWKQRRKPASQSILYLFGFGLAYVVMLLLVKKHLDRYALPLMIPIIAMAGFGLTYIWSRWTGRVRQWIAIGLAGIFFWQALAFYPLQPHFQTYRNQLGKLLTTSSLKSSEALWPSWGEGLREAAIYLRETYGRMPKNTSWFPASLCVYGHSPTPSQFPFSLKSSLICDPEIYSFSSSSPNVEFVLIQRDQRVNGFYPAPQIEKLGWKPEKIIELNGEPYVWIYQNQGNLPPFQ